MNSATLQRAVFVAFVLSLASCQSFGLRGGDYRVYETIAGAEIELERMVSELAQADVVFLGEEHDNDAGHRLQIWTLEMLAEQRADIIVSFEQFEADVQESVDAYLSGALSEKEFVRTSRPWSNYREHYRPAIEFAKRNGFTVVAANIPRPIARTVAYEGLYSVGHLPITPWDVWTEEPAYAERFAHAMGRAHFSTNDGGLKRWFAAQCLKDDKMADSIARALRAARAEGRDPLVVHLCGKFHSDYGLGTVSRLKRRVPGLDARVVGMNSGDVLKRELTGEEREQGDYIWLVRKQSK